MPHPASPPRVNCRPAPRPRLPHRLRATLAAACLVLLACSPMAVRAALPLAVDGQPLPSLAPMLERVTPAVVNISASAGTQAAGAARAPGSMRQNVGSGVIVDAAQGNILTNHHVVRGAASIRVSLQDGRSFNATVVGSDPDTDLAVLRIPAQNLQALTLSDSSDLRVGDFVVAIGDPYGLGQSASSGIVSALDRSSLRAAGYQNFIQTDASINPGNSGGALVNLNGDLVGINTMIYTPSGGNVGIGFAIPSNLAGEVMRQLLQHGQVQRGGLGLDTLDITPRNARQLGLAPGSTGVVVARVADGSPAQKAGIQARDQILSIDGKAIGSSAQLRNAEGLLPVGRQVRLGLSRAGAKTEVLLRIEPEQSERLHAGALDARLTGVELSEVGRAQRLQGNDGVAVSATFPERGPVAARLRRHRHRREPAPGQQAGRPARPPGRGRLAAAGADPAARPRDLHAGGELREAARGIHGRMARSRTQRRTTGTRNTPLPPRARPARQKEHG